MLYIDIELNRGDFKLSFKADLNAGITGLFGPSGCGKTTLLHCIAGLIRPDSGRIALNDTDLYNNSLLINMPARKRQIGLVFQGHLLFPHLTVEGNLKYGQKKSCRERMKQLCEIAKLLEITHLLKKKVPFLSGGEKQRVALGRAILSQPRLLLLDEPFTGLDQGLKRQLIPYLKRLYGKTRIPMILVSHSPEEMTELAEELFFIKNGRLFAQAHLKPSRDSQLSGRLCHSDSPIPFQRTRNLLIKNHTLKYLNTEKVKVV